MPTEQNERRDDAEPAAMKRHAAMPQRSDLQGMRCVVVEIVEEDIAGAAAEHDAERRPYEEIVDVLNPRHLRRLLGHGQAVAPADDETGDIGKRIPTDGERTKRYDNGVDSRVRDHK